MTKQTIVHVIPGLVAGGAENVLVRLASDQDRSQFRHRVVTLRNLVSSRWADLEAAGVRVTPLSERVDPSIHLLVPQLVQVLRREKPAIVQTWMYHADLVGGIAAKLAGSPPVVWNIRNGTLAPAFSKPRTLRIAKLNARLSHVLPTQIVCCAESAKDIHVKLGYDAERITVIPNGYDLNRFRPDPEAGAVIRASLGIPEQAMVMGMIARFHPQKDHATFFAAARRIGQRYPNVHFLLCGQDVTVDQPELRTLVQETGIEDRIHLIGEHQNVPAVTASLDISCLSSQGGEAFPNTVAEAMACGVPCIVTDVGDAALIVGDTGRVLPIGDVDGLAGAMAAMLDLSAGDRRDLGARARQRIHDRFDIQQMRARYDTLYEHLLDRPVASRRMFSASSCSD